MSTLAEARQRLLDGLEAAGIRTATTEQFAAPVVIVRPGDPWTEPQRLPGRVSRWRLMLVAGVTDTEGAFAALCDLIDAVDTALRPLDGVGSATWARPTVGRANDPNAPTYDICVATVEVHTS